MGVTEQTARGLQTCSNQEGWPVHTMESENISVNEQGEYKGIIMYAYISATLLTADANFLLNVLRVSLLTDSNNVLFPSQLLVTSDYCWE
jgi:hypothetical protein